MASNINSRDVIKAIAKRHKEDMFFTEVKDGPTQVVSHHSRIDAIGIKISWTNFAIIGYEVKVSRSDFLRDEKWRAYLPMCNQLYFAVAPNVCDVKEIPEECGMVLYSPNTGCIRTIKKAPFRNIDPPVEMFKYLMFTYIGPYFRQDSKYPRHERLLESEAYEMAKKYIEDKVTFREVGREFSGKLRRYITEIERKAQDVEYFEERAEKAEKRFDAICRELGVTGYYNKFDNCLEAIKHMKNGSVSPDIKRCVQEIKRSSDLLAQLTGSWTKPKIAKKG